MTTAPIDQHPTSTFIEFLGFSDWKGYASAMGYHVAGRAQRPGHVRMRRDLGVVQDIPCPPDFHYDLVQD